jgi:methylthioribose-1-phosphate isomerase
MSLAWEAIPPLILDAQARAVDVIDQTRLPFALVRRQLTSPEECVRAIREMWVRGAPLIGLTAAGGMALAAERDPADAALDVAAQALLESRPTAVNLRWALEAMSETLRTCPRDRRAAAAWRRARELQRAEETCCEAIGAHGLRLIEQAASSDRARARGRVNVLTHCNAGWLATGAWGTALAPIYRAAQAGIALHVWVDETRPRNQGARLTAWELAQAGIAHTLVVDSAAGHLMQRGEVDFCLVGSDRATRAGDVCNKIGTYQKALSARDNGVPFYVALPLSTFDWTIRDGLTEIPIEARDPDEVLWLEGRDPDNEVRRLHGSHAACAARNYAFDVTPARLVSGLLCEHGVYAANEAALADLRALSRRFAPPSPDSGRG